MAYVSQEMKSELAPAIKTLLNKYGLKGCLLYTSDAADE